MPIENAKVDENSNCEHTSNKEKPLSSSCTEYRMNGHFSYHVDDRDNDDESRMDDDGTVHNCNNMLSTHTKLLKTVGKSFR